MSTASRTAGSKAPTAATATATAAPPANGEHLFDTLYRYGRFENNILNQDLGFAYVGVPKAANTSVKLALLKTVSRQSDDTINGEPILRFLHDRHAGIFKYATKKRIAELKLSLIFSVVRNPMDRIISCYRNKVDKKFHRPFAEYGVTQATSFDDFVEIVAKIPDDYAEIHFRSQVSLLHYDKRYLPEITLRSETLHESWCVIQSFFRDRHGLAIDDITMANKSAGESLRTLCSARARRLIAKRYENDIDFFGYSL